jgi:large subunit ribosomal protein L3
MAGRMGSDTVTVRGLTVVKVDNENNQLLVKGLVPGAKNGLLIVTKE